MAQAMTTIISAIAQLEHDQLSERTTAGMAVATANRRPAGRREVRRARELRAPGLKPADIGRAIAAGRATVCRYLGMDA